MKSIYVFLCVGYVFQGIILGLTISKGRRVTTLSLIGLILAIIFSPFVYGLSVIANDNERLARFMYGDEDEDR